MSLCLTEQGDFLNKYRRTERKEINDRLGEETISHRYDIRCYYSGKR